MSGVPHGEIGLGGPGLWVIFGIMALAAIGAAAVLIDLVRRPDRPAGLARRALWGGPQAIYLAAFAWGVIARAAGLSARAILVTLPVAAAAQFAYVLRVVSPKRRKAVAAVDAAASDTIHLDEDPT